MALHTLNWLDWTDVTRQGAHTSVFTNLEEQDFLVYLGTASLSFGPWAKAVTVGGFYVLQFKGENTTGLKAYFSQNGLLSEKYVLQAVVKPYATGVTSCPISGGIQVSDLNDYKNYSPGHNALTPLGTPVPNKAGLYVAYISSGVWTYNWGYKSAATGLWVNVDYNTATYNNTVFHRTITMKDGSCYRAFVFSEVGAHIATFPAILLSSVYEGSEADKLLVGFGGSGSTVYDLHYKNIAVNPFDEEDWLLETEAGVATTGAVSGGAATAKEALSDRLETTYIDLDPGETITITIPSAASEDRPMFGVQVNADCTDSNLLDVQFATDAAPSVWTTAIQIGSTKAYRNSVTNISPWTNGMNHILWPEIQNAFGLNMYDVCAFRYCLITNNSGVTIPVRQVWMLKSLEDITYRTLAAGNIIDHIIPDGEAPIGSVGDTQILLIKNTSDKTWTTVKALLVTDGYAPDAILEYSADEITWYDEDNPPPDPVLGVALAGTPFAPEDSANLYVRTNIPNTGDVLESFRAKFRISVEV